MCSYFDALDPHYNAHRCGYVQYGEDNEPLLVFLRDCDVKARWRYKQKDKLQLMLV
jgi:hypothetical protein